MVTLVSLLLPILVSAVLVFLASFVLHMVLRYHWTDYGRVENEAAVSAGLRLPPGDYVIPYAGSPEAMKSPEYQEKKKTGPEVFMTVVPNSASMGRSLALWFVFCVVVSVFAAYIASRALRSGAGYMPVFRFTGATAFVGYTLSLWTDTIWYHRAVATNLKNTFDGLVYALLTAGVFGWLWPN